MPSDCGGSKNNIFICAGKTFSRFTSFFNPFERKREGMLWYFRKCEANTHKRTHTLLKVIERGEVSKDSRWPHGHKVELRGAAGSQALPAGSLCSLPLHVSRACPK